MNQLLNQKAIDRLFEEAKGVAVVPDGAEAQVRPHTFQRSASVGAERRTRIETVQQVLAERLSKILSFSLRTSMQVEVLGVEESLYSEFVLSLATPCAAVSFPVGAERGASGLIDWGAEVAFFMVDRLLGGTGAAATLARRLSATEQGVLRGVIERSLGVLSDAWKEHVPIRAEILGFESLPENVKIVGPEDRVLVTTLAIRSDSFQGVSAVALPLAAIAGAVRETTPGVKAAKVTGAARADRDERMMAGSALRYARVTVTARLPVVMLPARELSALSVGRTLDTGLPCDTTAETYVNGKLLYRASIGKIQNHVGLSLAQRASIPPAARPVHTRQGRVL
jgi:flagellar motor switch protein FliM